MDPITNNQTDDQNWEDITAEITNPGGTLDSLLGLGKSPVPGKKESGAVPVEGAPSPSAEPVVNDAVPKVADGVAAETLDVEAPIDREGQPGAAVPAGGKAKPKKSSRRRREVRPVPKHVVEEGEDSTDKKISFLVPQTTYFLFQCIVIGKGQKCSAVFRSLIEEYVKQNASVLDEVASRISGIV